LVPFSSFSWHLQTISAEVADFHKTTTNLKAVDICPAVLTFFLQLGAGEMSLFAEKTPVRAAQL
jgi:hypothetical protein